MFCLGLYTKYSFVLCLLVGSPECHPAFISSAMSVSIKVAVRCRPFTIDDDLGVNLAQCGEEEGEVRILLSNEVRIYRALVQK